MIVRILKTIFEMNKDRRRHDLSGRWFILVFMLVAFVAVAVQPAQAQRVIRDDEIEQGLRVLATPLFHQAGITPNSVTFVIIDDPAINAFVAGGMNIFFNTGLLIEADDVMELVGVIAHETGHISAGHLVRMDGAFEGLTFQAMIANVLGMAAAIAGAGDAGMAVASFGSSMVNRQMLGYSRVQESAADQSAVRFLKDAGLSVKGMHRFMEKLSDQDVLPQTQQTEYARTHPLARDRVSFLEQQARNEPPRNVPPGWEELYARMRAKLMGYLYPDQALRMGGDSVAARYSQAIAHYRKGQREKALEMIEGLLAQEPDNPWFYELKGQVLFESGAIDDSVAPYRRAAELRPQSGLIMTALAHALIEQRAQSPESLDQAIDLLNRAIARERFGARPHRLLAIAYGRKGDEGMMRLHLAEEALMLGRIDFAQRQVKLALPDLKEGSPGWMRAQDIEKAVASRQDKGKN